MTTARVILLAMVCFCWTARGDLVRAESEDRTGTLWAPFVEWRFPNSTYSGNPFDVVATARFSHSDSGETRITELFYDGFEGWRLRFVGTEVGTWTFVTSSTDPELDGHEGRIVIDPNPGVPGFVTSFGNKWGRSGTDDVFVPQFAMYTVPQVFYQNPDKVDRDIATFLVEHGFTGLHVPGGCYWFDIEVLDCSEIDDPNPDPRTFDALEMLIRKVHAAGGTVHIWLWGDDQRQMTPKRWGLNGSEDRRLQRYIAARLGPLSGWTMSYGFDLWEWVTERDLQEWHSFMHAHMAWPHLLGARAQRNQLTQIYEGLDYASYEQHLPDYDTYVRAIEARPNKPSFSEDRFRIRGRPKDYTMEDTVRGLWRSAMAGGVANIWGNLRHSESSFWVRYNPWRSRFRDMYLEGSAPYPEPAWIKTYSEFFKRRFVRDMVRCNELTDGVCLKRAGGAPHLFYKEDAASIVLDLSRITGKQGALAVDARKIYEELDLGVLDPVRHVWQAPYPSDWAIAVGPSEP